MLGTDIHADVDLQTSNSLAVASRCDWYTKVDSLTALVEACQFSQSHGLPILPMGEGTNVVLRENISALVVQVALLGKTVLRRGSDDVVVDVAAGENWHDFVLWTLQQKAYGLENLALIPGTCGAAPIQNIGAYGIELDSFVDSVEVFDIGDRVIKRITAKDCDFSYRESVFKQALLGKVVVMSMRLRLHTAACHRPNITYPALSTHMLDRGLSETPEAVCASVCAIRKEKLPDPAVIPNAGSFFKNPLIQVHLINSLRESYPEIPSYETSERDKVKVPAAWLIEQAGWKGYLDAGVGVHTHQALVLVNPGRRPAQDILDLAGKIVSSVENQFGILLEQEPRIIG